MLGGMIGTVGNMTFHLVGPTPNLGVSDRACRLDAHAPETAAPAQEDPGGTEMSMFQIHTVS